MYLYLRYGRARLDRKDAGVSTLPNGDVRLPSANEGALRNEIARMLTAAAETLRDPPPTPR